MPRYLFQVSYTTAGLQGVVNDSASGRRADVQSALRALGGKLEALYFAFGEHDAVAIADLPNAVTAAAFSLRTSATGTCRVRAIPLLTVEEMDQALEVKMQYRAPGE
jgi:uncharacterized protein with GYD domain